MTPSDPIADAERLEQTLNTRISLLVNRGADICEEFVDHLGDISCRRCGYRSDVHLVRDSLAVLSRLRAALEQSETALKELSSGGGPVADHLFLGTAKDNAMDASRKGRHGNLKRTHCPQGHPYAGDNLEVRPNGFRRCLACRTAHSKRKARALRKLRSALFAAEREKATPAAPSGVLDGAIHVGTIVYNRKDGTERYEVKSAPSTPAPSSEGLIARLKARVAKHAAYCEQMKATCDCTDIADFNAAIRALSAAEREKDALRRRERELLAALDQVQRAEQIWNRTLELRNRAEAAEQRSASLQQQIQTLVEDWRENMRRSRANAENDQIPALDRRQCFGVSQAYEQCAEEALAALGADTRGPQEQDTTR